MTEKRTGYRTEGQPIRNLAKLTRAELDEMIADLCQRNRIATETEVYSIRRAVYSEWLRAVAGELLGPHSCPISLDMHLAQLRERLVLLESRAERLERVTFGSKS